MQNDHPLVRELRAVLTIQAAVRGKKLRGWSARARAALAEDSSLHRTRIRMAQRQAERDLNAARKGAVTVRILGGNTLSARIGRSCENITIRIILNNLIGCGVSVIIWMVHWVFLWLSIITDTDEYWHALLALQVAGSAALYFTWLVSLDLTLMKFCYRHLITWLNVANILRWSIAFLLCRGGTVTNACVMWSMWNFVLTENNNDAMIGFKMGQIVLILVVTLGYCMTLYLMSTQHLWLATETEYVPAREVDVFQNTTFSYTVDLRETHNSALLQLIFFVAADGYAYLKMAYKLRTFNAPPFRSVRIKVPLHLEPHHEWGMRLDDPKLVKRADVLYQVHRPRTTSTAPHSPRSPSRGTATEVV